jgi:putative hydrolase of the HAD superfamily
VRKAVLLDALGTLLELEPPWPALVTELAARRIDVGEADARRGLVAEMAHYQARCHIAVDRGSLAELRAECTEVLRAALPAEARQLPAEELQAALLASLRFRPYPEVPGVLAALRAAGLRLVVVSNWDVSLHDVLSACGLDRAVDGVVTSAETGASKPDPVIFARALALAGAAPAEALHVGDSPEADAAGARAAGIAAVLVARGVPAMPGADQEERAAPPGVPVISSLAELPSLAR